MLCVLFSTKLACDSILLTANHLKRYICHLQNFRPSARAVKLAVHRVPAARSPGIKCLECKADHLPASSAKVKKTWSYTSILLIRMLFGVHLLKLHYYYYHHLCLCCLFVCLFVFRCFCVFVFLYCICVVVMAVNWQLTEHANKYLLN
jgi:hypothetical protein